MLTAKTRKSENSLSGLWLSKGGFIGALYSNVIPPPVSEFGLEFKNEKAQNAAKISHQSADL